MQYPAFAPDPLIINVLNKQLFSTSSVPGTVLCMKIREELNKVPAEGIHSLVTTSEQMLQNNEISYIYQGSQRF